nr:hypothetical protein [Escherichia coli]
MNIPVKRSSMPGNRQPTNIATGKERSKQRPKNAHKIHNTSFVKGQEAVHFLPLVTFPQSSIDELTDQFQNCNQRVCKRSYRPQNDD